MSVDDSGRVFAGPGSVEKISEVLQRENAQSVLLFTDKGVRGAGLTKRVEEICSSLKLTVIDDLATEPSYQDVERVIAEVSQANIDLVIGVGGGSVMDAAKLASIVIGAEYGVRDLLKDPTIAKKYIKSLMIPTTCGTGSEATQFTIITDTKKDIKMLLKGKVLMPKLAIIDSVYNDSTA